MQLALDDPLVDFRVEFVLQTYDKTGVPKQLADDRIMEHINSWMEARVQTQTTYGVLVLFSHDADFADIMRIAQQRFRTVFIHKSNFDVGENLDLYLIGTEINHEIVVENEDEGVKSMEITEVAMRGMIVEIVEIAVMKMVVEVNVEFEEETLVIHLWELGVEVVCFIGRRKENILCGWRLWLLYRLLGSSISVRFQLPLAN